ncbi:MAG: hypothetical protein K2N95_01235 [Lachnospiraceae bacterium]|nr:hypothetical protein [Lachnospiraceae bacterium]
MDQNIGEREAEQDAIERVKKEYDIAVFQKEQGDPVIFAVQSEESADQIQQNGILYKLELVPRVAAMRRNPSASRVKRLPCMADINRVETRRIRAVSAGEEDCGSSLAKRLLPGALAYQNLLQVPLCFVDSDSAASMADFFERFGFHYIYDRPCYDLNPETISADMMERAAAGETVSLDGPNITLQMAAQEDLLALAHFVNARLCRQYRFFPIRSAAYYERMQETLQNNGGNLFQIMEDGVRKGCFAYAGYSSEHISEVVFDKEADRERYLVTRESGKPAVMARIVNLSAMLKHISGTGKITVAIRLTDPVIAENDGLFLWYIDTAGSRMERVEQSGDKGEADASMRPEITTTIGAFTAFIFDYIQLKQNAKFDSIYLAGPAWMNEID